MIIREQDAKNMVCCNSTKAAPSGQLEASGCFGSKCMAWVWSDAGAGQDGTRTGHCGLVPIYGLERVSGTMLKEYERWIPTLSVLAQGEGPPTAPFKQ